jgi:hypothetical protein
MARKLAALSFGVILICAFVVLPASVSDSTSSHTGSREPSIYGRIPRCIAINRIFYDAPGRDLMKRASLNGEWIQLSNSCLAAKSLDGWMVRNSRGKVYRFPDYTLVGGGLVRIYTGKGATTQTYRYWRRQRHVWNNRRDRARLTNARGRRVHVCSYRGRSSGHVQCARYAPPSTESEHASFRVECPFSHRKQVDPIVAPGPKGTQSAHLHDFFGNESVDSDSTYQSMLRAPTTCGLSADKAGYWVPSLMDSDGRFVKPDRMIIYYRPRPIDHGTTIPFPPDFRAIAGGIGTYPHSYWTCDGQSDSGLETRAKSPPDCGSAELKLHVYFPSCWDGLRSDSSDHRSHVAYAFDDDDGTSTDISDDMCPKSHPVKIPQVHVRVLFPVGDGPSYHLSDHTTAPHADFWNTWRQAPLERLVRIVPKSRRQL